VTVILFSSAFTLFPFTGEPSVVLNAPSGEFLGPFDELIAAVDRDPNPLRHQDRADQTS
jgi:hypothetical protein